MYGILEEERFDFVSEADKSFIRAFDEEMARLDYDYGGKIGPGYIWGRYMMIYTKTGAKSKTVYARIYMRDTSIALRLFLNNIDKHRGYIESTPPHIKEVFVGEYGDCKHDRIDKNGRCMFQKSFTLDGRFIEKCNSDTFWFPRPNIEYLKDYIDLFTEFFPSKRVKR